MTWTPLGPVEATIDQAPAGEPVVLPEPPAAHAPRPDPLPVPITATVTDIPPTVPLHTPNLLVTPPDSVGSPLTVVAQRAEVDYAASGARFPVTIAIDSESDPTSELEVLAADPEVFRPLTPEVTAQSVGVWQRLLAGDVVLRHDVAHRLGIELGSMLPLITPTGLLNVRVGALASNGVPPLADILMPWEVASAFGVSAPNLLIVAGEEGVGPVWLGEQLVEALGGGSFQRLDRPQPQRSSSKTSLESFTYTEVGDGTIIIDPAWVRRWIVTVELPIVGRTRCNRLMVPQLTAALEEIRDSGLAHLIDPRQFGGCWVARHIDWDARKPISMHAWGLAIDFNTRDNPLGRTPTLDMRIVSIFDRWGFAWGGRWSRPDGMHFELARLIDPD